MLVIEADASGRWLTAAAGANWLIWAVFAVELAAVLIVADRKGAALRAHWLDVAIVVLTVPLFGRLLSSLRFIRLVRLLRLLRVGVIVARALQAERRMTSGQVFRVVALITLFIVVVAGAAQATFDADEFHSVWDGVWSAMVTVTTVGYGDLYPKDVEGRLIAMVVMPTPDRGELDLRASARGDPDALVLAGGNALCATADRRDRLRRRRRRPLA